MEWLAVASARTPSVPATTRAETTSQTLASTRIWGAVCRSSRVSARAARPGIPATLVPMSEIVRAVSAFVTTDIWLDHLGQANLHPVPRVDLWEDPCWRDRRGSPHVRVPLQRGDRR